MAMAAQQKLAALAAHGKHGLVHGKGVPVDNAGTGKLSKEFAPRSRFVSDTPLKAHLSLLR
jgi:hypothetical protein